MVNQFAYSFDNPLDKIHDRNRNTGIEKIVGIENDIAGCQKA